jgi:hypothetical protein
MDALAAVGLGSLLLTQPFVQPQERLETGFVKASITSEGNGDLGR